MERSKKRHRHSSQSSDDSSSYEIKRKIGEESKTPLNDGRNFRNESRFRYSEPVKRHYDDNERHKKRCSDFHRRNDSQSERRQYRNHSYDTEFAFYRHEFEIHKGHIEYRKISESGRDLFEVPEDYCLAHCVAEDMNMGSGIAVQFRRQFKRVDELLNQRQTTGGLAILSTQNRFIYYLVTKKYSYAKPTYSTLFSSLKKLRYHVIDNKVKQLAMPRIGCGLDRLEWINVKFMIEFIFKHVDIKIVVCNFEPKEDSPQQRIRNCKVTNQIYPIENIQFRSVILYFSSEDGFVSDEMIKLNKKFYFYHYFSMTRKTLGDVVLYSHIDGYLLCGCIVKKNWEDPFDFVALTKCLSTIQKENLKFRYYFYAFQAIKDCNDPKVNYKIINILRNGIFRGQVYVCWPGDLISEMSPKDVRDRLNENNEKRQMMDEKNESGKIAFSI